MTAVKLLLLPGMDGTGLLFRRFVEALPAELTAVVCSYDKHERASQDELLTKLPRLTEPHVIVGESFSGPLALRRAVDDVHVRGVVLVASFVRPPRPFLSTLLGLGSFVFRRPPPRSIIRHVLLGGGVDETLVNEVHDAIASVGATVLADRLRQIGKVDVRPTLGQLTVPLLYLRARRDRLVPGRCGTEIVESGPNRRLVEVDAGHLALQSRPLESAAHVVDFTRTLA